MIRLIVDQTIPKEDVEHFNNTVARAINWNAPGHDVAVTVFPRQKNGWLEYGINVTHDGKRVIFIAAIQRDIGAESEFHS